MKYLYLSLLILMCGLMLVSPAAAKDKKVPLSGTWDCQSHGGNIGETAFTLYLQQSKQDKESVDGTVSSPIGGGQISSGTYRSGMLEVHVDSPQGAYILMARMEKGKLSGTWSTDSDKGTWDGTKHGDSAK
jgi:hypothetical protein